jgi:glycosyltransferase involved in cell wall biosynthesis
MSHLDDEYVLVRIGPISKITSAIPKHKLISPGEIVGPSLYPIYFNAADVLLMPSLSEGFGRPVIEALNSGLPVIASDIGAFREILGDDYPLLVNPALPLEWVSKLKDVISSANSTSHSRLLAKVKDGYYRAPRAKAQFTSLFRKVGVL